MTVTLDDIIGIDNEVAECICNAEAIDTLQAYAFSELDSLQYNEKISEHIKWVIKRAFILTCLIAEEAKNILEVLDNSVEPTLRKLIEEEKIETENNESGNSSISNLSSQQNGAACSCELDKIN